MVEEGKHFWIEICNFNFHFIDTLPLPENLLGQDGKCVKMWTGKKDSNNVFSSRIQRGFVNLA